MATAPELLPAANAVILSAPSFSEAQLTRAVLFFVSFTSERMHRPANAALPTGNHLRAHRFTQCAHQLSQFPPETILPIFPSEEQREDFLIYPSAQFY